jgi:AcrR family transcriptional regulator
MPRISDLRRDQRRRQILDAAQTLFARDGFHQTGMADIVAACGLSRGAVYGYFAGKDEIIEALADVRHADEDQLTNAALANPDPVAALRLLVRAYAGALSDADGDTRRRVAVHGWAEALRSARVRARIVEGVDAPRRVIAQLVAQGRRCGAIAPDVDGEATARTLIALFQGFVLQATRDEKIDISACMATVDRMIDGLLSPVARS